MTDKKDTLDILRENLAPLLEKQAVMLMAQYDKNGDGVVEFEEVLQCVPGFEAMPAVQKDVVKESLRGEFDKWDINKDGKVEKHEFAKFIENTTMELIKGQILEAEKQLKLQIVANFAKFDKNGDGFLDKAEFDEMLQSELENCDSEDTKAAAVDIMNWEEMDANKDSKISFDEYWDRSYAVYQQQIVKQMKKELDA